MRRVFLCYPDIPTNDSESTLNLNIQISEPLSKLFIPWGVICPPEYLRRNRSLLPLLTPPLHANDSSPTVDQPRRMEAKSISFAHTTPTFSKPIWEQRISLQYCNHDSSAQLLASHACAIHLSPILFDPQSCSRSFGGNILLGAFYCSTFPHGSSATGCDSCERPPERHDKSLVTQLIRRDHQSWFNDPRFDGSFPSRVLPFLYLGNLNHAANAYMLHALGITHVVSVEECALVPPPNYGSQGYSHPSHVRTSSSPYHRAGQVPHYVPGKGPGQSLLWHEEREGRIMALNVKGVCADGIDTPGPELEPIRD